MTIQIIIIIVIIIIINNNINNIHHKNIGKNRIAALAAEELKRKEEEKSKEFLCENFGLSEKHLDVYYEYYYSKKDSKWISNLSNDITWSKEYKRWLSRIQGFFNFYNYNQFYD